MSIYNSQTVLQAEVEEQLSQWIKNDPRRIRILAEVIVAIPLSRSVQGSDLAENILRAVQAQSIQQMLRRFYQNPAITWEAFYLPLLQAVRLRLSVYEVVIDTTQVGAGHRAVANMPISIFEFYSHFVMMDGGCCFSKNFQSSVLNIHCAAQIIAA